MTVIAIKSLASKAINLNGVVRLSVGPVLCVSFSLYHNTTIE